MEYLTNSSNIQNLLDYNRNDKEYEDYEKYLNYYYQLPSKKDQYDRKYENQKYILEDKKNPKKKIIIDPARYVNLFELFKNLKKYNEIILEKVSLLVEKPGNIDDNDRKYFDELKKNYSLYNKKITEIDSINKDHLDNIENLTIQKIDNSLIMAKYFNERNLIFKRIINPIKKESKIELTLLFNKNGNKLPEQNIINKTAKMLDIPSDDVENWLLWIEKCYQYLQSKKKYYETSNKINLIKQEFLDKCENFIIKKPIIET